MKRLFFIIALTIAFTGLGTAQISVPVKKGATLPATCSAADTQTLLFYKTGASNGLYICSATDTWTRLATGGISGPGSSTDNAIVRFDGSGGGTVQNSPVTIADTTGAIAGTQSVAISGSTSGSLTINTAAAAGTSILTLPAGTTNFSATGGASQVVQQTTAGGALTVGQLAASNLSNGTTGSGSVVLATSPTLVTPALGTPTSATLTNATGLPISSGVSGLGTGVATALGTPSSANLATAITDETGSGSLVFGTSPTLTTPNIGTPSAATLTNATGLPIGTGVSGLGTGVATFLGTPSSANLATAMTNETGSGSLVFATSPTLVTPALGTPSSGVATNLTGLPLTTGVTGVLPVANGGTNASSAGISAFNNITGYSASGATGTTSTNLVFSTSPTLTTPNLGTPSAATLTNATGLPLTTGVTGTLPIANGGTNASSASAARTNLGLLTAYLASTVTYNNTSTLANTALSVSVEASGIYEIELVIHATSAAQDLNVDFGGTATITNFIGQWTAYSSTGDDLFVNSLRSTSAGTDFNQSLAGGVNMIYTLRGSVEINAAGTFLVRGAQRTAAANNTTIERGSTLKLTKMN